MSELRLPVWTVECGERRRWFPDQASAREFANNEWDKETDGVPFVKPTTIWDVQELCAILNEIEFHAENAPVAGELRLGVFSNRMA